MTALYISVPGDIHFLHVITSIEAKEELEKQSRTKKHTQEKKWKQFLQDEVQLTVFSGMLVSFFTVIISFIRQSFLYDI